jgi:hypothetical protein
MRWFKSLFQSPRRQQPSLQVEALEERQLMTTGVGVIAGRALDDMTGIAMKFSRHDGPTILALNFDGSSKDRALPFVSTSGDREKDIQTLVYQTSEIFAPFDVEVIRVRGDGFVSKAPGATTVFVGISPNGQSYTPGASSDHPGDVKGNDQRPNSDAFDIGYVDQFWSGGNLAGGIAHEAGHTFGLVHVLTDSTHGLSDDARQPLTGVNDVMSYNGGDTVNQFFADQIFDVTDLNATAKGLVHSSTVLPKWNRPAGPFGWFSADVPLRTQDSFSYLQTVLGSRPADDQANVADPTAVDPHWPSRTPTTVAAGSVLGGAIDRLGDYDVFQLAAAAQTCDLTITVQQTTKGLNAVVMVFDEAGKVLQAYNADTSNGETATVSVRTLANRAYKIVVGALDSTRNGNYQLTVSGQSAVVPLALPIRHITFNAESGILQINGTALSDTVIVSATKGVVHIQLSNAQGHEQLALDQRQARIKQIVFYGGAGNDHFENETAIASVVQRGLEKTLSVAPAPRKHAIGSGAATPVARKQKKSVAAVSSSSNPKQAKVKLSGEAPPNDVRLRRIVR